MLEKQANPLTFLAQFIASKVGATGLTVTVDVWEIQQDGTATEIVTAGSATEIGDGLYRYILASGSVDANAEYICVFKTASASVDQQHLAAFYSVGRAGVANLDAPVSAVETDTQNIQSRLPAALSAAGRMIASLDEVQGSTEAATNLLGMLDGTFAGELLLKRIVIISQTAGQPALQIATTEDDTDVVSVAAGGNNSHAVSLDAGAGGSDVFLNEANLGLLAAIWGYASRTLSAAGVQAIWDALTSALTTAGSIGKFLVDNVGGGTTPAEIWDYLTANILTAGSIGKLITDKLALIIGGSVTVQSPLSADGQTMTIIQGDDYNATDGRAFEWSSDDWPDLTGATVVWTARKPTVPSDTFTTSMTVVTSGGGTQEIRLELPAATTSDMTVGENSYRFDVQATLASGRVVTLVHPVSVVTVYEDITDN